MRSLRDSPSGARLLATKPNSIERFSTMLGTGNRSTPTMHSKVIELPLWWCRLERNRVSEILQNRFREIASRNNRTNMVPSYGLL